MRSIVIRVGLAVAAAALVAGCNDNYRSPNARHYVPLPSELLALMDEKGMAKQDPILIRSFKKEAEIEIWKKRRADGKFELLRTYPICRWSGQLGPKHKEGDRQAPEGFYTITARQMNPASAYHLSFDTGYPNAYDRANGYSGSALMVHGACSSRGCFSMTDKQIEEIYALVREAHNGGQQGVQMQSLPFRFSPDNLAKHRFDPNMRFWRMLKDGTDSFESLREEPKVAVCGGRYVFNRALKNGAAACDGEMEPAIREAVSAKQKIDEAKVAELVAKGTPALRVVYQDGGQHPSFRGSLLAYAGGAGQEERVIPLEPAVRPGTIVAEVSRPEALDVGPAEVPIGPDGKPILALRPKVIAEAPPSVVKPVAKSIVVVAPVAKSIVVAAPKVEPPATAGTPPTAIMKVEPLAEDKPFYKKLFSVFSASREPPFDATGTTPPAGPPIRAGVDKTKPRATVDAKPGQKTSFAPGDAAKLRPGSLGLAN